MLFSLFISIALSFSFVLADSHTESRRRLHARHASAQSDNQALSLRGKHELAKRFDGARFTFYQTGLGACGQFNSPSDFIVALNSAQYDGGSHCHQMITISAEGKTTQAQIMDECPGCPFGGLDLSKGLFSFFASPDAGVLTGSWNFGGGGGGGSGDAKPNPPPAPKPQAKPSSTSKPPPPPTTTTTTSTKAKSTSTSAKSSKSTSSSTSTSASATKSNNAVATGGPLPSGNGGTINAMDQAIMGLAGMVDAGRSAQ